MMLRVNILIIIQVDIWGFINSHSFKELIMKNKLQIIIISAGLLLGQTADQIKKAKDVIERTGMSESQAIDAAKARGFTDKQIDNAIKKEKALENNILQSNSKIPEKTGLPDLGKSNEIIKDQPA